jgi:hypothetical protein
MIQHIDLLNLSHYDYGFTEHQLVCREMQKRYLQMVIELVQSNRNRGPAHQFRWTCESNLAVYDWWQEATCAQRDLLLELVAGGWIEVCALPFNHVPTMNAREWYRMAHWLPEELHRAVKPRTAMQNDVNGFPRAGMMALLGVGVEYLWMGINRDTGGSPVPQPSAFWWEMPDGRKALVWNSLHYGAGYNFFEAEEWRRGPIPTVADTRYRPPRQGDFFEPTPANLRRAHEICLTRLEALQASGYPYERLTVSMTNMWRMDNDPPCPLLPDFVAAWHAEGLEPALTLTTPSQALDALRATLGPETPTLTGEWTNWWANGLISMPQELAASRRAKHVIEALHSPLYPPNPARAQVADECLRQVCLFDEHTGGSWNAESQPDTCDSKGQFADKMILAYRPLALAQLSLGDANRAAGPKGKGVHVINPYSQPFAGWVSLTDDCLRDAYAGVEDLTTGEQQAFVRLPGPSPFFTIPTEPGQFTPFDTARTFADHIAGKNLRMWVENLAPHQVRSFRLLEYVEAATSPASPQITTDANGWPESARWGETELFRAPLGDFLALETLGFAPRWKYKEILSLPTEAERRAARERDMRITMALADDQSVEQGLTTVRDTGPTLVYEQYLSHPRLRVMRRVLEVFKGNPRAHLEVTIHRTTRPESAEIFYVRFPLHLPGYDVTLTSGGLPFHPGQEQIPQTCKDYFASDGPVTFSQGASRVVLQCHDNALVSLGGMYDGLMQAELGRDLDTVYAILYNNIWYCNFVGDETGVMEFAFDLYRTGAPEAGYAPAAYALVNV